MMEDTKMQDEITEVETPTTTTTSTSTSTTTTTNTQNNTASSQPASGGWGGSWWSAATSLVTNTMDQYIKPTVSTVTETTTQLVKELVREEEQAQKERATDDANHPEQGPAAQQPSNNTDFFSMMDKSLTMIGDSVDVLGDYLGKGINKVVENTSDINAIKNLAASSLEKAKTVATVATEKGIQVGEQFATTSVNALETVGKTALDFLTVQDDENERGRTRPTIRNPSMTRGDPHSSFEDVLKKNYFEENNGVAFLQVLEKMSVDATLKFSKVEQQLDPKLQEEINELIKQIKVVFDEEQTDVPTEVDKSIFKNTEAVSQEATEKVKEILQQFTKDIGELKPSGTPIAELAISSTDVVHLTASYLDKILLESVKLLSKFSATSVGLLLHVIEEINGKPYTHEEAKQKALYVFKISQLLAEDLSKLSNIFIEAIHSLSNQSKELFTELASKGEQEKEESAKCTEDIAAKTELHVNHIHLDTNNSVSNIADSRQFLFIICKSLFYSS